jgi:hypothetical protein
MRPSSHAADAAWSSPRTPEIDWIGRRDLILRASTLRPANTGNTGNTGNKEVQFHASSHRS